MPKRPARRVRDAVAAGGVVVREGEHGHEVVIAGREGMWVLPKGTPDQDERIEDTAKREVREETGLDVRIVRPRGTTTTLLRTPLFEEHVVLGAKMVPFAGWEMPIQYPDGIVSEHRAVRSAAGMFDLSHMGEVYLRGPRAGAAIDRIVTSDIAGLEVEDRKSTRLN